MFFLNLTAAEFLTLLSVLGGLIAALYLLDRTKRKKVVSTLKFWTPAVSARESQRRKRVRDPWSLVLQLTGLLLLLLAIAQLQWGARERNGRNYVLLLDASAWSAQRDERSTVLDREKKAAELYISALAPRDRIMLVRTDALTTPLTPFTADRTRITKALHAIAAGYSALNMEQALTFAEQAQRWSGGARGEVVYIGPAMTGESEFATPALPNLRVIAIERGREHVGIRSVGVQRNDIGENAWQASVTVKNYGAARAIVRLQAHFAGTAFASRVLALDGGAESAADYQFLTNTAGQFVAELQPGDNLMGDHRVALQLPRLGALRVAVFTNRPEAFKPLFNANNRLQVRFFPVSANEPDIPVDVMILDRTSHAVPEQAASIWIDPPRDGSPLPIKTMVQGAAIHDWRSETPLGEGLHARDTRLRDAEIFQQFDGDIDVGNVAEGPVVVARGASQGHGKLAVIGFDLLDGEARLELTTPLLFANLLRWTSPEVFRSIEFSAEQVGEVTVPLEPGERADQIHIFNERGMSVPFLGMKENLALFTSTPEIFRVSSERREHVLSVTVPDVAAYEWNAPARAARGIPGHSRFGAGAVDLWRLLAVIGGLALLVEWIRFGRQRVNKRQAASGKSVHLQAAQPERELVSK